MKKLLVLGLVALAANVNAQTASVGKIFDGEVKGKKIQLGTDCLVLK